MLSLFQACSSQLRAPGLVIDTAFLYISVLGKLSWDFAGNKPSPSSGKCKEHLFSKQMDWSCPGQPFSDWPSCPAVSHSVIWLITFSQNSSNVCRLSKGRASCSWMCPGGTFLHCICVECLEKRLWLIPHRLFAPCLKLLESVFAFLLFPHHSIMEHL